MANVVTTIEDNWFIRYFVFRKHMNKEFYDNDTKLNKPEILWDIINNDRIGKIVSNSVKITHDLIKNRQAKNANLYEILKKYTDYVVYYDSIAKELDYINTEINDYIDKLVKPMPKFDHLDKINSELTTMLEKEKKRKE